METDSQIEKIKRCALRGIAACHTFREVLVLKGGNAIDVAYGLGSRASLDLDYSMSGDFSDLVHTCELFRSSIETAFASLDMRVIDFKIAPKPEQLSEELSEFWGGYQVSFKLVTTANFELYSGHIERLRQTSISISPLGAKTFTIDISKFEFCDGKVLCDLEGYTLFVYSLPMLAAEKFRSICQQMPEYAPVVRRSRRGAARARDFVDLYILVSNGYVNIDSPEFRELLHSVFSVKRVPLTLLGKIDDYREFHRADFQSVVDTVKPDAYLEDFDFYVDFVCSLCLRLKALWNI